MPDGTVVEMSTPVTTPSPAAPAPQPVATPAPVYTQEQVDAMLRQAHDSAAAAVRRSLEAKTKQDPAPSMKPDPQTTAPAVADVAAMVAREVAKESAFGDAVREYGLTAAQLTALRSLRSSVDLPDAAAVATWTKENAALFGNKINPAPVVTSTAPTGPAPISPSAPGSAVPLERDVSVLEKSAQQVHDFMRQKGGDPSNPYHPRNRAARREIRIQTEAALATRRIGLTPK